MSDEGSIFLPSAKIRSLNWVDDSLVDWCSGGVLYGLDGTIRPARVNYAYNFDAAVVSPSGRFSAIYTSLGTKGLILDRGEIVREIDRSFYCANAYVFPIGLFLLEDGREVIIHCPHEYNELVIEELESGRLVSSASERNASDFFHSRLMVSPSRRWLVSAGWVWHPWEMVAIFDLRAAVKDVSTLDRTSDSPRFNSEIQTAAFRSDDKLLLWSGPDSDEDEPDDGNDEQRLRTTRNSIATADLIEKRLQSVVKVSESLGSMMPVGLDHVVGFYDHPKLVYLPTGKVIKRWPSIAVGQATGSISYKISPVSIALDSKNKRFAVADGNGGIHVVNISDADLITRP